MTYKFDKDTTRLKKILSINLLQINFQKYCIPEILCFLTHAQDVL